MTDPVPRLAPRSAVAAADLELLRVARAELAEPEVAGGPSLGERVRGLARLIPGRAVPEGPGPDVRRGSGAR